MAGFKIKWMGKNKLIDAVQLRIGKGTFAMATKAVKYASDELADVNQRRKMLKFYDVTGNTFASIGFTVSRFDPKSGRRMESRNYAPISGKKRPTRDTLGPGERYNSGSNSRLTRYYSGYEFGDKPFAPSMQTNESWGGRSGIEERMKVIEQLKGYQKGGQGNYWKIYAYIGIPYAKYLEAKHNVQFLPAIMESVKDWLDISKKGELM